MVTKDVKRTSDISASAGPEVAVAGAVRAAPRSISIAFCSLAAISAASSFANAGRRSVPMTSAPTRMFGT